MRSGLRRAFRNQGGPPVPMSPRSAGRGFVFNLGSGRQNRETFLRAYGMSGTVFSIVSLLQQSSAYPKWRLFKKPSDGRVRYTTGDKGTDQRVEVVRHAALQLWDKPNDFHTGFEFREGSNQHLELTGETFWVVNTENVTFPISMWYVRPDRMEPVADPDDFLRGWIYSGPNGEQIPLENDEVILEKMPDPLDPFRGSGPVASIMSNIEQQKYATDYQRNLFQNGADPGGVITVTKRLSDREWDEFNDRWRESHQGVARAGRVGVLENGATWSAAGQSNKDLEYGNLRLANRDELREAWRMHKSLLGTVEDVNRANAQTAEEVFVSWSTVPRLERRKNTLDHKFLPLFGQTGKGVEFDYDDPNPDNREEDNGELTAKTAAFSVLIDAGVDPDDAAEVVGLPSMAMVEKAVQIPVVPPGWVPAPPGEGGAPPAAGQQAAEVIRLRNESVSTKAIAQLSSDFPPDAIAWAYHATWTGPIDVPLNHIDPDMSAFDQEDPEHVQDFVAEIRAGNALKPVILVKRPNFPLLLLVDGHHRELADELTGVPVTAFIATVSQDYGPWQIMHRQQIDRQPDNMANAALMRLLFDSLEPEHHNGHKVGVLCREFVRARSRFLICVSRGRRTGTGFLPRPGNRPRSISMMRLACLAYRLRSLSLTSRRSLVRLRFTSTRRAVKSLTASPSTTRCGSEHRRLSLTQSLPQSDLS